MKTAFLFRLRFRHLSSAYDLVKTRLSESEAEAEEFFSNSLMIHKENTKEINV